MHRRHNWPSALFVCGWLLMTPPITRGNVNFDAPVTAWDQHRAFDSANACERGRATFVRSSAADEAKVRKDKAHDSDEVFWGEARHDQARAARCVPAEYMYPPRTASGACEPR
jgi:hypothetical protein